VGRLKEVASRNGRKVSLAEVDDAFRSASGLAACAAFPVADAVTGERIAVAVLLPAGADLDVPRVLDAMVAAGLAKWKLPESVVSYGAPLPVTPTGKVERRSLSEDAGAVVWRADRLA
jgi:acyl-CoA synthetase (AMP-forming)/AMP-acid ligase II